MSVDDRLFVRSHVARDLLQSASLFKSDRLVVWEYVSNGLQYVDPGTKPVVKVKIDGRRKQIRIEDNGRGMDWSGLHNFFVMHGENLDRAQGRPGRGRFGTGKSAAFGIANVLRITTVRGGRRSIIELRRDDIEKMKSGDPIPVRVVEKEAPVDQPNGTVIEIDEINLRTLDQRGIIAYIERHLARWPRDVTVFVNNHQCEYAEPPVAWERRFKPEGPLRDKLGDTELIIKVSKSPLDEDQRGISIFANGVWYETTLAGSERRDMAQYIFGEIDVPRLDEDTSPIAPFDLSRSMKLNPNNELVQAIYAFIGRHVEEVRRELVEDEKRRRDAALTRKLAEQGSEIARVINEDFTQFRNRVARARATALGGVDAYGNRPSGGDEEGEIIFGSDVPATIVAEFGSPGRSGTNGGNGEEIPNHRPQVVPGPQDAAKQGQRAGGTGSRPKPAGGFAVQFSHMGIESHRAVYVSDDRTIHINLDHPQIAAAIHAVSIDDPAFRRLAYEVAFSEYAIALAYEMEAKGEILEPSEAIFEIRDTLNRIARKAAALYEA